MKGLFILYRYTPEINASSIQNQRFIEAVNNAGVNTTVICKAQPNAKHQNTVIPIQSPSLRYLHSTLNRTLPDLALLPDIEKYNWTRRVQNYCKTIHEEEYNWVHTTSSLFSSHLVGKKLKNKLGLPWIAQFFDPLVDNFNRNFRFDYFRKYDLKYEKMVAENADIIIHSNELIAAKWRKRYGEKVYRKILVLPFIADSNLLKPEKSDMTRQYKKISIIHAGSLGGERDLSVLIEALNKLRQEVKDLEEHLVINLIGWVLPNQIVMIKRNKMDSLFKVYGIIPQSEVQNHLRNANILLVIDSLKVNENIFFPSKLVDYFVHKKPIIGITSERGVTNNLLSESGHIVIHKQDSAKLKDILKKTLENIIEFTYNKEYYKEYLPSTIAAHYLNRLQLNNII